MALDSEFLQAEHLKGQAAESPELQLVLEAEFPLRRVWGPFLTALGVVALTLWSKRSRGATENPP